jgi:DNA-binding NtrC family response regulator
MNIVLVENDIYLLKSLELVLKGLGHSVRPFCNPLQAEACISEGAADIEALVVDYLMPGMDGLTLLKRIRGALPEACRVILISGHQELLAEMALESFGLAAVLPKPLDLDRLQELVEGGRVRR